MVETSNIFTYNTFRYINTVFLLVMSVYLFGGLREQLDRHIWGTVTPAMVLGVYGLRLMYLTWINK